MVFSNTPTFRVEVGPWTNSKPLITALSQSNIPLTQSTTKLTALFRSGGTLAENLTRAEAETLQTILKDATDNDIRVTIVPTPNNAPTTFTVQGSITQDPNQFTPPVGITIRVYDRDLRTEQLLGETILDATGRFTIQYTRDQFRRADKATADLDIRLFNPAGTPLDFTSEPRLPVFNAGPEVEIDLTLQPTAVVTPSNYERLRLLVDPILEGASPATLTPDEIGFIISDFGGNEAFQSLRLQHVSLSLLKESSKLAQSTNLATAIFYGLSQDLFIQKIAEATRAQPPVFDEKVVELPLDDILDLPLTKIQSLLEQALDENWIPADIREQLDEILASFGALNRARQETESFQIVGRLLDHATEAPLFDYTVSATILADPPESLGTQTTDAQGEFTCTVSLPTNGDDTIPLNLRLQIFSPTGEELEAQEQTLTLPQTSPLDLIVSLPDPEPIPIPGADLLLADLDSGALGESLPPELIEALPSQNLNTLADIRAIGGVDKIQNLPLPADSPLLQTLNAQANLSVVSSDLSLNKKLSDAGFKSVDAIANAPFERYLTKTQQVEADRVAAVKTYALAQIQNNLLNNQLTEYAVASSQGRLQDLLSEQYGPEQANSIAEQIKAVLPEPPCQCDCNHALSPAAYLAALLDYLTTRLTLSSGEPPTLQYLAETFHQPFDRLPLSCSTITTPISQVRLCVEALRGYLTVNPPANPDQLEQAEHTYRFATYQQLLRNLGTTYDDVRLARVDEAVRQQLSDRLMVSGDHLSNADLFFEAGDITEGDLLRVFGYARSVYDLDESDDETPLLLQWQQEKLREDWFQADWPTDAEDNLETGLPLIDPDIVPASDVKVGTVAFQILTSRRHTISERASNTQSQYARTLDGLNTLLTDYANTSVADVKTNIAEEEDRKDISDYLKTHGLTRTALFSLGQIIRLLENGQPLANAEWAEVGAIATQEWKRQQFSKWQTEENRAGITLSPDFFQLGNFDISDRIETEPELEWRIDLKRQQVWRQTLSIRIRQQAALEDNLQQAIRSTETNMLPMLRDAMISESNAPGEGVVEQAEWLTQQLQIDMRMDGCQVTTRVGQAIESLQNLVFSIRTGQLEESISAFKNSLPMDFEEAWQWLSSYAAWKSAMSVHLYPENVLLPSLRERQTPLFEKIVREAVSNSDFSAKDAENFALEYENYFRDLSSLEIHATCSSKHRGSNKFFTFGSAKRSEHLYWSAIPANGSQPKDSLALWRKVPLHEVQAAAKPKIIGAAPYLRVSTNERFICLFLQIQQEQKTKLYFLTLDIDNLIWDRPIELDLLHGESGYEAILVMPPASSKVVDEKRPPRLIIGQSCINESTREEKYFEYYTRGLNDDLNDWENENFISIYSTQKLTGYIPRELARNIVSADRRFISINNGTPSPIPLSASKGPTGWVEVTIPRYVTQIVSKDVSFRLEESISVAYAFYTSDRNQDMNVIFDKKITETRSRVRSISFEWLVYTSEGLLPFLSGKTDKEPLIDSAPFRDFRGDSPFGDRHYRFLEGNRKYDLSSGQKSSHSAIVDQVPVSFIRRDKFENNEIFTYRSGSRLCVGSLSERYGYLKPDGVSSFVISKLSYQYLKRPGLDSKLRKNNAYKKSAKSPHNFTYLDEAYYFLPLVLAGQLSRNGRYLEALNWYRSIYDYSAFPQYQRIRFPFSQLIRNQNNEEFRVQIEQLLNPHYIASNRENIYIRYTLLSTISCLLDYADSEFTRDTQESLSKARTLYSTALEILEHESLETTQENCNQLVLNLLDEVADIEIRKTYQTLLKPLSGLPNQKILKETLSQIEANINQIDPLDEAQLGQSKSLINTAVTAIELSNLTTISAAQNTGTTLAAGLLSTQLQLLPSRPGNVDTLLESIDVDSLFNPLSQLEGTIAKLEESRQTVPPYLRPGYTPQVNFSFCIPPNPVLSALKQRVTLNLTKIRSCRNIAGLKRQLDFYAVPTSATSGLASVVGVQLNLSTGEALQPTQYRYAFIIERTKELINIAQQLESAYLSAFQNLQGENYSLFKANQDLQLARAGVKLQDLRVQQAQSEVILAQLQKKRSVFQQSHYDDLIDQGRLASEIAALSLTMASLLLPDSVGASNSFSFGTNTSASSSISVSYSPSGKLQTLSGALSSIANHKRREQEWQFQSNLARQDVRIGNQQIRLAESSVDIVEQERNISDLQVQHAEDTAEFLITKNLNAELYAWMTNILRGVYSYFLQQATTVAKLAETQLAFERQASLPAFIQANYWNTTPNAVSSSEENTPDRFGLTGSARLLQDIYKLDQYAFETNQRKLQLTKTISLAQYAPFAFQQFRETGILQFNTPMSLFDRDFPGHYLRLIRQMRTSVIALIPPTEGIKATLRTSGNSRVVISQPIFQTVPRNLEPQSVALTSPINATGLFELQQQPEFLLPFEGLGVDTDWTLELPKASNPFDFNTIADVLITIDYTALHSEDYRQQVLQQLDTSAGGDRAFSFRNEFADAWYDLHNPEQTATPGIVKFTTRRADFPPNINDLTLSNVRLYFALKEETPWPQGQAITLSTSNQEEKPVPDENGIARFSLIQLPSTDEEWQLTIPENAAVQILFANDLIEDILLIVTYDGQLPSSSL